MGPLLPFLMLVSDGFSCPRAMASRRRRSALVNWLSARSASSTHEWQIVVWGAGLAQWSMGQVFCWVPCKGVVLSEFGDGAGVFGFG